MRSDEMRGDTIKHRLAIKNNENKKSNPCIF